MSRPGVREVQTFCQRVRSAGSPAAKARARLVREYQELAERLNEQPEEVETGLDLPRSPAGLLRVATAAEAAAAADPLTRLRRLREG
ncbi:MAG: hypothetical protein ACR2N6_06810 [Miltoncostaeaceae bacterium]